MSSSDCFFCAQTGGEVLWSDRHCRVVWPCEPDHPGLCRVVWNEHRQEMSDLDDAQCTHLMGVVLELERALRQTLAPDKINLASLGNVVPHIHWHVIPRWRDDPHFPQPIWSARQRDQVKMLPPEFSVRLRARLSALPALRVE